MVSLEIVKVVNLFDSFQSYSLRPSIIVSVFSIYVVVCVYMYVPTCMYTHVYIYTYISPIIVFLV